MNTNTPMLYSSIIKQLYDDGYTDISYNLSSAAGVPLDLSLIPNFNYNLSSPPIENVDKKKSTLSKNFSKNIHYNLIFSTSHRLACNFCTVTNITNINSYPKYSATCSNDGSIKIIDNNKVISSLHTRNLKQNFLKPLIKTLLDPTIITSEKKNLFYATTLDFHPIQSIGHIASGYNDGKIRIFDFLTQKSKNLIFVSPNFSNTNLYPISAIKYHPSGEYIISSDTNSGVVRLYKIDKWNCYISNYENSNHLPNMPVSCLQFDSNTGTKFLSCSYDGSIKLWDAVNLKVIYTINSAHCDREVSNIAISRNGKFLVSGGFDSVVRVWDLDSKELINSYYGAYQATIPQKVGFTYTDSTSTTPCGVVTSDQSTSQILFWDLQSTNLYYTLNQFGHNHLNTNTNKTTRWFDITNCGGNSELIVSACDDNKARFWIQN